MIASYYRMLKEWHAMDRSRHHGAWCRCTECTLPSEREGAMLCDRCRQDRFTLYRLHALGSPEEVCVNCLTDDEHDFIAERNRRVPQPE